MRHHILGAILFASVSGVSTNAAMLVEDFNSGIPAGQWETIQVNSPTVPWTIEAPDALGRLRLAKPADNDSSGGISASLRSRFSLVGDFSAFVGFDLLAFPFSDLGWNEAVLRVGDGSDPFGGNAFMALRFTEWNKQNAEGFASIPPYTVGTVEDSTVSGRFGITRTDNTLSAWIDRGSGPVLLGSVTSSLLAGPMRIQLIASQVPQEPLARPHTALDVRFDNLVITADSIVPEPATLALLGLGSFVMMRRRSH